MRRLFFPLIILALIGVGCTALNAGAAPSSPTAAGAPTATLPLDVQRAMLDVLVTSTAQAQSTAVAATALRSAAATAERVQTEQALELEQQQAALAAVRTQSALTITLQIGAATAVAGQTQRAAAATIAAEGTRGALDRLGLVATATAIAARAEITAAGVDGLRGVLQSAGVAALLLFIAIVAVLSWGLTEREKIKTDTAQRLAYERTEQERLRTEQMEVGLARLKAEAMRSLMLERDGQPWVVLPNGELRAMLPAGPVTTTQPNRAHEWRWRVAAKTLVNTGIALGEQQNKTARFGERDLASAEHPYVVNADGTPSSAGYRDLQRLLVRAGVWVAVDRVGTKWARGWNAERFAREFDGIDLPDLPKGEPPEVRWAGHSAAVPAAAAVSAAPQA